MSEQSKPEDNNADAVGYRNPPKATRFRPGQSGNPKGRPKGALNMATVLERTLRERVTVNEGGKRKTINKLEAAVMQLSDKAAAGDLKAVQLLTALVRSAEERATLEAIPDAASEEVDEKIVLGILKRIQTTSKEDSENADEIVTE